VEPATGATEAANQPWLDWVRLEGLVSELYDVVVLPGVVRPMALGFKTDEIQRLLTIGADGAP
jgi:hypothetical protein